MNKEEEEEKNTVISESIDNRNERINKGHYDNILSTVLAKDENRKEKELNYVMEDDEYKLNFSVFGGEYLLITSQGKENQKYEDLTDVKFDFYYNKKTGRVFGSKAMFDKYFRGHNTLTKLISQSGRAFFIDKDDYGKKKGVKALELNKELKDAGLICKYGAKFFDVAHLEDFFSIVYPNDKNNNKFIKMMDLIEPFIDTNKIIQRQIEERSVINESDDNHILNGQKNKRTREDLIDEAKLYISMLNKTMKNLEKYEKTDKKKPKIINK